MRSDVDKIINYCIDIHYSRRLSQRSRELLEVIKSPSSPKAKGPRKKHRKDLT